MFELSYYPVINPKLSIECVLLFPLLSRCLSVLAMQYGLGAAVVCAQVCIYQPSRVDPRLLEARSPHYIKDGPKKRQVIIILHANLR